MSASREKESNDMRSVDDGKGYALLDSGYGRKLERFGEVTLSRPCAQAIWKPALPERAWIDADAVFDERARAAGREPAERSVDRSELNHGPPTALTIRSSRPRPGSTRAAA